MGSVFAIGQMRSASRTLTKCALPARFLFSNFTENLKFEEKKEYVEILSIVDLHAELVERSLLGLYALRLHYFLVIS